MTDNMFKDMREQMSPDKETLERLQKALEESPGKTEERQSEPAALSTESLLDAKRKRKHPLGLYLTIAAAICVVMIAAGVLIQGALAKGNNNGSGLLIDSSSSNQAIQDISQVRTPADYKDLYNSLETTSTSIGYEGVIRGAAPMAAGTAEDAVGSASNTAQDQSSESQEAPASSYSSSDSGSSEYSETNVQVPGIDEGDIIKTDGKYIYAISQGQFLIFRASGEKTEELSRVQIAVSDKDGTNSSYPQELYLSGSNVLIVLNQTISEKTSQGNDNYQSYTQTLCFDVSDPASPSLITEFSQSGYYNSSRLNNGILYLISSYGVYDNIEEDDPTTYIPLIGTDGDNQLMRCEDLRIMPQIASAYYTVITSIDATSLVRIDQKSILGSAETTYRSMSGSAETIYMSDKNLYIASTITTSEDKEPYKESVYTVQEYVYKTSTQIARISLDQGILGVEAQGEVDGSLLNQFSLDEYQGNLRLVTTNYQYAYKVYRDDEYGVEDTQYEDNPDQTNAVYVLDPSLQVIGSLEGLAQDESIYSARFSGPVGYMVTYKQVDPLFALDLSDPHNPRITSELKIPGFSTYLHPYGENELLGFGYDVTENQTSGLKLSMFDISDPFDVSESAQTPLDLSYSDALYDHKAILVDASKNIIGFPGDQYGSQKEYLVYSYDEGSGFILKGRLELGNADMDSTYYYSEGIRALYIDSYLYVYSGDYLDIFTLNTLEKIKSLQIQNPQDEAQQGSIPPQAIYTIE